MTSWQVSVQAATNPTRREGQAVTPYQGSKHDSFRFWVFPRVFCVAHNQTYRTAFYRETEGGGWERVTAGPALVRHRRGASTFIRATGSCKVGQKPD